MAALEGILGGTPMPNQSPAGPILIVEDDPDMRSAMTMILESAGYEVVGASEGREALDRLREPSRPCLILLDLMLPGMDGFELRVQQMQDPTLDDIPVIVFSAGADLERKVVPLRVDGHLEKPVDIPVLLELVGSRCAKDRPERH
jgi:CheY-like chemotaxis protein